jgi:predicted enzyme related to lactoylglutathione lyase
MWLFYFGVEDIDAAAERIGAGGGTIVQQPMQIPGGEYALVAADPQGPAFGLVGPRREQQS